MWELIIANNLFQENNKYTIASLAEAPGAFI